MHVAVLGTGYVGLVLGACLAESGNSVICADVDGEKIKLLSKGHCSIYEPGLEPLLKHNLSEGRLRFTTSLEEAIESSDIVFIAVGTPSDTDGSADLSYVLSVAESIGKHMNNEKIVLTKSTVPVGTAEMVRSEIEKQTDTPFYVCSNPEFLKEGTAVEDFMRPDRIVIGTEQGKNNIKQVLEDLYNPFVRTGKPIIFTDTASAEMIKYAANTMLAVRISFMNQIAALCEKVGADIEVVRRGIGADPRIGSSFLFAGAGYGGSCFPKDVRAVVRIGAEHGLDMSIASATDKWNEQQKLTVVRKVAEELGEDLSGHLIAVWGLSFKPGTDDIREAASLSVIPSLLELGAEVIAHDPRAIDTARNVLPKETKYSTDEYTVCKGADALVILTEWQQYRRPDMERIHSLLKRPLIIDGRNLYRLSRMSELGFVYHSIGRAAVR